MQVTFDHISLSAKNPELVRDFLVQLLNLRVGERPALPFAGYFLYAGEKAYVHIFGQHTHNDATTDNVRPNSANIVHHFCFFSDNYEASVQRIHSLGLEFNENTVPGTNVRQLFVRGPEELLIEIKAIPESSSP